MNKKKAVLEDGGRISRRAFCGTAIGVSVGLTQGEWQAQAAAGQLARPEPPGSWTMPRQNRNLTAVQPMPGKITTAPEIAATLTFPRGQGALFPIAIKPDAPADHVLAIADGRLRCYRPDGKLLWEIHPAGLNFHTFVAAEDLDGDGRVEIAVMAGRSAWPLGAATLIAAETGKILFRYDVEPMSYHWAMQVGSYLPDGIGKQVLVSEHGYPPDAKNGYIALFAFEKPGQPPRQRWRYDFDHYTCFPSILTADVNGDGVDEICVETHSKMWVLDARAGKVNQFIEWNVSPGNVRSYGLVRFQDLNGDGLPDFFCIANFAQHHEALLNEKGTLKQAWAHGWDDSVTTSTIATAYPESPIADVDGDGKLEMVVSMFHAEAETRWMVRVYDALTGALKAKMMDRIAIQLTDIDGDGVAEIVVEASTDPTQTAVQGVGLLKWKEGGLQEIWRDVDARVMATPQEELFNRRGRQRRRGERNREVPRELAQAVYVRKGDRVSRLRWEAGKGCVLANEKPPARPKPPDYSHIPATVGPALNPPLVADVDGDGKNEILHYHDERVTLYRYEAGKFVKGEDFPSSGAPALADLDGDGRPELIVGVVSPTTDPTIRALKVGKETKPLWEVTLARPNRHEMPHTPRRPLYFQTGRFLGKPTYDLYLFVGTPIPRSLVLDGSNGKLVWEKAKAEGIERYYAPTTNHAAVWDANGDGKDDLVFNCPDYYCIASGPTGEAILGPAFPPQIFKQPSQGLYTLPAILPNRQGEPTVCLVDGHYFQGGMSLHAAPMWYQLPLVGEAHAGAEGFLQMPDGRWLMGFGRQNGKFACLEAADGKLRWEYPLQASAGGVCACDIDGDGIQEFVFGTSHGDLYALADKAGKPRLVWKTRLPASVADVVIADVDGDGASEILATLGNGELCLLRPRSA